MTLQYNFISLVQIITKNGVVTGVSKYWSTWLPNAHLLLAEAKVPNFPFA